jgi:hypothetical protein
MGQPASQPGGPNRMRRFRDRSSRLLAHRLETASARTPGVCFPDLQPAIRRQLRKWSGNPESPSAPRYICCRRRPIQPDTRSRCRCRSPRGRSRLPDRSPSAGRRRTPFARQHPKPTANRLVIPSPAFLPVTQQSRYDSASHYNRTPLSGSQTDWSDRRAPEAPPAGEMTPLRMRVIVFVCRFGSNS